MTASSGFKRYAAVADSVMLFDTNGPRPRPITIKEIGGELAVLDQDAYDAFQAKTATNPRATGPDDLYPTSTR